MARVTKQYLAILLLSCVMLPYQNCAPTFHATNSVLSMEQASSGKETVKKHLFEIGVNLSPSSYYQNTRRFMNLLAAGNWQMSKKGESSWLSLTSSNLDRNQNLIHLAEDETAIRAMGMPTKAYRGESVEIVCRWSGTAKVGIFGEMAVNTKISKQKLTFTFKPKGFSSTFMTISQLDEVDPIRDMDCREADADPYTLFDPTFLNEVRLYSTIRFMGWQPAVISNGNVRWETRTKPGDGIVDGRDSTPIEYMVELANITKTNPWFCIPWNADDDYIRRFAEYVRDHLDPGLRVYVETSNEVWNSVYKVTGQARTEGLDRGLSSDPHTATLKRYAQKTIEVMDIWSLVFKDEMSRLVRVAATQHALPWGTGNILNFKDIAKKIDALATAPYIGANLTAGKLVTSADFDKYFESSLPKVFEQVFQNVKSQKDFADKYGLRYITYEGGQHILSPEDVGQLEKLQRDPRMGALYMKYLTQWYDQVGDLMTLFSDTGPISKYGSWGHAEYTGQPLSEAPKAKAVDDFVNTYVPKNK